MSYNWGRRNRLRKEKRGDKYIPLQKIILWYDPRAICRPIYNNTKEFQRGRSTLACVRYVIAKNQDDYAKNIL
jgi:hypothetical protein